MPVWAVILTADATGDYHGSPVASASVFNNRAVARHNIGDIVIVDEPFELIIEAPIENVDGTYVRTGPQCPVQCHCLVSDDGSGPRLVVNAVKNALTGNDIVDNKQLPSIRAILRAADLLDWADSHQQVFSNLRVM